MEALKAVSDPPLWEKLNNYPPVIRRSLGHLGNMIS